MASGIAKVYLQQMERSTEDKMPTYRVTRLVGTCDLLIGQVLSYARVKDMCAHYGIWEVHIGG